MTCWGPCWYVFFLASTTTLACECVILQPLAALCSQAFLSFNALPIISTSSMSFFRHAHSWRMSQFQKMHFEDRGAKRLVGGAMGENAQIYTLQKSFWHDECSMFLIPCGNWIKSKYISFLEHFYAHLIEIIKYGDRQNKTMDGWCCATHWI